MPSARRGEVWQVDFGMAAKVRPALVLGCDIADQDRVWVALVYHTMLLLVFGTTRRWTSQTQRF